MTRFLEQAAAAFAAVLIMTFSIGAVVTVPADSALATSIVA